jgi:hypothetical protein
MGKRVKVGDVIEVATKRGLAYVQLTHRGRLIGDVVQQALAANINCLIYATRWKSSNVAELKLIDNELSP